MKQVKEKIPFRLLAAMLFGLFLSLGAHAQITVNGHVKDAQGEPVIGATVRVAETKVATVTDFDGNFTLQAQKGAVINVTYIGYKPASVTAAPSVTVTLSDDDNVLNDVVVIGYGRAKKSDLTGSVTAIKPDDMNHGLNTNVQDMIAGKIAGVNITSNDGTPGSGAQIRVRGGSSLNASNDPLIVVDGLAMDSYGMKGVSNPLSMVNPNDIESVTVLKDASATAIYGSRASNGVIIITTKKGRSNTKPSISYNGNISVAAKKKTLDVMDGPTYMNFIKNLYDEDSDAYNALGWTDDSGVKHYADTDWQDQIYRTAVSTDHNITITGGLKDMPYRASLGYTNNQGIVKTSKFERFTASINVSPSFLNDHLKFNINAKGMYAKNRYADGGAISAALYMDPTKPVYANNTIYNTSFGGYCNWYQSSEVGDSAWPYSTNRNATQNPVGMLNNKNDHSWATSFVGNIEADYAIHGFEDLHLHINAGMDFNEGKQTTDYKPYATAYESSNAVNYFGYNKWDKMDTYNLQLSMYAQYMKDFAKVHHIDVMAGYEWQHYHKYTNWYGEGHYQATHPTNAGEVYNSPTSATRYMTENYLVSFFGRLNYTLMDRYLLTFTLRDDGSSRFSKDNRWGVFPSVALAWRIKEEPFLRDVKAVTDLKLRLGWGKTGQQDGINDFYYIQTYTPSQDHAYYPITGDGSTTRPDAYNLDLTWEKTTTWNAGLDLGFWNDRLIFNIDWYYRKTTDLINTVYIEPGGSYRNKMTANIGSLHNTGVEFSATIRPIQKKDWRWELNLNATYNKNKIDELNVGGDNAVVETGDAINGGIGNHILAHIQGEAVGAFYVYQQAYDENGKPLQNTFVDRNGNGTIDSGDRYVYYKPAPDVTLGFASKLIWRNWDFSFSMRANLGNYVYNNNLSSMMEVGAGSIYSNAYDANRTLEAVALGFTSPNAEQRLSDYFVQNASFLKMDNITLGYSFNKLFGAAISGRVYATVQNVFTITKYDGIDPEVATGIDNNLYPRPITSILGLSLNF